MTKDPLDPTGIIAESFRIDDITLEDCRSIFLDWVLKMPVDSDMSTRVRALLDRHGDQPADHPMTRTLELALTTPEKTGRRGGRGARLGY